MGGRGRGMNRERTDKGRKKRKPQNNWTPNPSQHPKGKYGKGGKGKTQTLGVRKPKFTGNCSHCGIIGHMARDCYKRQQGTKPIAVKQLHTNVNPPDNSATKRALIEFQHFPTFVKRKLKGIKYHEPDASSSSDQDTESRLSTAANNNLFPIDDEESIGQDAPTWGTRTDTTNRDSQHTWGGKSTTKQTRHNSPDLNAYRSGQCTYCDCNIDSKCMHGPLICYECHI